jgi:peptidoglycan/xylan/chitin deacetylase (PgdA/CDA1 family)
MLNGRHDGGGELATNGPEHRRLTLTFDNGPTPGITDRVLDVLAEREVIATFFVIGDRLRANGGGELARRAVAEGHRIGHHTMTHSVLLGLAEAPEEAVDAEIAALAADMEEFDGDERLYRPYAAGGVLDRRVFSEAAIRYLQEHAYTCVLWNSVPHDWDDPSGWVDRALADVAGQPWTVVVLHDIDGAACARLTRFLDELSVRGVEVVAAFPDSCVPIRRGRLVQDLSHLTKENAA